jgi:hypothetical protein
LGASFFVLALQDIPENSQRFGMKTGQVFGRKNTRCSEHNVMAVENRRWLMFGMNFGIYLST